VIAALAKNDENETEARQAIELFKRMQSTDLVADAFTLSSVLKACGTAQEHELGKQLHVRIDKDRKRKQNREVNTALMTMNGHCGMLDEARQVFNSRYETCLRGMRWSAHAYKTTCEEGIQQHATNQVSAQQQDHEHVYECVRARGNQTSTANPFQVAQHGRTERYGSQPESIYLERTSSIRRIRRTRSRFEGAVVVQRAERT
jgi:hypothetical protein